MKGLARWFWLRVSHRVVKLQSPDGFPGAGGPMPKGTPRHVGSLERSLDS